MDNEYVEKVLRASSEGDCCSNLFWKFSPKGEVGFFVGCNDIFYWGCADCEEITPENVDLFVRSIAEAKENGDLLFCARVRNLRPQGAVYEYLDHRDWPLFDASGPERLVDFGNPKERPPVTPTL